MKDYIVLDVETPNLWNDSISSIGIIVVKNDEVVDEIYSLINPEAEFDETNIDLTNIYPEDVKDSPTFDKYWENIKDLLTTNIIVGQNITFDLEVISMTLSRYNIALPSFNYYCTLKASRKFLDLPGYRLQDIVNGYLNLDYDAHNSLADAQVTNILFQHLKSMDKNPQNRIKTYSYMTRYKKDYDDTWDIKLNYLYGLIQRFKYDANINKKHLNLIRRWYEENNLPSNPTILKNVNLKLKYVLEKDTLTKTDIKALLMTIILVQKSSKYSLSQLSLTTLKAIIDSMLCYDNINADDVNFLDKWLRSVTIDDEIINQFYDQLDSVIDSKNYESFKEFLEDYTKRLDKHI